MAIHEQDRIWAHFQNADPEGFAAARPRLDYLVRAVGRRVPAVRPVVLNIGVGDGYFERTALSRGWEVHALDPDAVAISRVAAAGAVGHVGYLEHLPLAQASLDAVVASEVLEHLRDDQLATGLREIARVLKPNGWFVGTVPYNENLKSAAVVCPCCGALFHRWGHHQSFTLERLRETLSPLFHVQRLGRTAFSQYRGRGVGGKVQSLARTILARAGHMIAVPSIYWVAQRSGPAPS
jgi:SAM-dependent methyltransferase